MRKEAALRGIAKGGGSCGPPPSPYAGRYADRPAPPQRAARRAATCRVPHGQAAHNAAPPAYKPRCGPKAMRFAPVPARPKKTVPCQGSSAAAKTPALPEFRAVPPAAAARAPYDAARFPPFHNAKESEAPRTAPPPRGHSLFPPQGAPADPAALPPLRKTPLPRPPKSPPLRRKTPPRQGCKRAKRPGSTLSAPTRNTPPSRFRRGFPRR